MRTNTTALIYIGQTPRNDITPELKQYLGKVCDVIQTGVLDGLTSDEISSIKPRKDGHTLITRLRGGETVTVDEECIRRLIIEKVISLAGQGISSCAVMCTGSFPGIPEDIPVVTSDNAFHRNLVLDDDVETIGVLVPMEDQQELFASLFEQLGRSTVSDFASPYGPPAEIIHAALRLKSRGADCICLDCMGYDGAISDAVARATGLKCYIPREEIAKQIIRLYR